MFWLRNKEIIFLFRPENIEVFWLKKYFKGYDIVGSTYRLETQLIVYVLSELLKPDFSFNK